MKLLFAPLFLFAALTLTPSAAPATSATDFNFAVTNGTQSPTTQVTIAFPAQPTVASVNAGSVTGWTPTVYAETGTVSSVVYQLGTIAPGATTTFVLTFTVPDNGSSMPFKVTQGYLDGTSTTPDSSTVTIEPSSATTSSTAEATTSSTNSTVKLTTTTTTSTAKSKGGGPDAGIYLIGIGAAAVLVIYGRIRAKKP